MDLDKLELERKALMLYQYIVDDIISYGRAAEILGINKFELIDLYNKMNMPLIDLSIEEIKNDVKTLEKLFGDK